MPAKAPSITKYEAKALMDLGQQIRARREKLGISATATAEASGISRITLHRVEKGEPSVAIGAYVSVILALGLKLSINDESTKRINQSQVKLPKKIRIGDYAQLKKLAWQLSAETQLSPKEALEIYERNWRHIDLKKMDSKEKKMLEAILNLFGRERLLV